jgi:hypothetical protein
MSQMEIDESIAKPGTPLWEALQGYMARAQVEKINRALRSTASSGTFDEMAVRKAVGFELAEMIMEVREEIINRRRMACPYRNEDCARCNADWSAA